MISYFASASTSKEHQGVEGTTTVCRLSTAGAVQTERSALAMCGRVVCSR
jgi:hypothetical protein